MTNSLSIRLLSVAAMLAFASSANAILIDDFTDDQVVTALTGTEFDDLAATPDSGFIGTNRRITVSNTDGETTAKVNLLQQGFLDLQNSTSASGIVTFFYTGIGGFDFTEAGASKGFYLGLPSPIQEPMTIAFDIEGSLFERTFSDGSVGDDFFFPFLSFTDQSVFSNVDSVSMTMSSTNTGWDASIDLMETRATPTNVPIPGTLSLLTLGLIGLRLQRRNRS